MEPVSVECWEATAFEWEGQLRRPLDGPSGEGVELSFAGAGLSASPLLSDVKVFALRFDQPMAPPGLVPHFRPLWAAALLGLLGQDLVACVSADMTVYLPWQIVGSDLTYTGMKLANWLVDHELMPRHLWHSCFVLPRSALQVQGREGRFFFECPRDFVWPYLRGYGATISIVDWEGYVLDRGSLSLLGRWNLQERGPALFDEVMDAVFAAFHMFADNHGILVCSRKTDLAGFRQRVGLDGLVQLAAVLSLEEQAPYWQMLTILDRFPRWRGTNDLGKSRSDIAAFLQQVERLDSVWAEQFRTTWAEIEQAFARILQFVSDPAHRFWPYCAAPYPEWEIVWETVGKMKEMVWARILAGKSEAASLGL